MNTLELLEVIKTDCRQDTKDLEGRVFSAPLMAEHFGLVRAQIFALASIMADELTTDLEEE